MADDVLTLLDRIQLHLAELGAQQPIDMDGLKRAPNCDQEADAFDIDAQDGCLDFDEEFAR